MDSWINNLTVAAGCILLSGYITASASAIASSRKSRVKDLAESGDPSARRVLKLLQYAARILAAQQITVVLLWLIANFFVIKAVTPALAESLLAESDYILLAVSLAAALITTLFAIIFGEILPRSIGARYSENIPATLLSPMAILVRLLAPVIWIVSRIARLLLMPFNIPVQFESPQISEEELKKIVEVGQEQGVIEENERDMIDSILKFTDTVVRQVMVPRIDIIAVDVEDPIQKLLDEILACGHSRIPVYEETVDHIIGIIHAKDLLEILRRQDYGSLSLRDVARPAYFIPETKRVSELLGDFRANNLQMAIVRDEYGGTAGLVTVEDLLEEIVGEIRDEYDHEEPLLTALEAETFLIDARLSIDDLNEELDTDLPEGDYETVGGFFFSLIGKEPEVGDQARYNGWLFTVEAKEDRRLKKIKLEPAPSDEQKEPDPSEDNEKLESGQSASG